MVRLNQNKFKIILFIIFPKIWKKVLEFNLQITER